LKNQKTINANTPGVAIVQYKDGETEMVNLKEETMRCCLQYEETEVKDGIDQIRFSFPQEEELKYYGHWRIHISHVRLLVLRRC